MRHMTQPLTEPESRPAVGTIKWHWKHRSWMKYCHFKIYWLIAVFSVLMVRIQTDTLWPPGHSFCPVLISKKNTFQAPRHSLYLAHSHLGLLLAAVLTVWLQRGEAELPEQVTGAAQQVAGKAKIPARFWRQLGTKRWQLERKEGQTWLSRGNIFF